MGFFVALLLRMTPINAVSGWTLVKKTAGYPVSEVITRESLAGTEARPTASD